MPLSKKKDRERKRKQKKSNPIRLENGSNSNPNRLESKQATLNQLRELIESKSSPSNEVKNTMLPVYNKAIHKPGDRVLVPKGKDWVPIVVPDIDKDGHEIPAYW